MRLPLTRSENIELTIIITHLTLSRLCLLLLVRLGGYIVNLCAFYSYSFIRKLVIDRFFAASGVQLAQHDRDQFHWGYRRAAFSSHLKVKVSNILVKAPILRINLNIDGTPIISQSHTHPSHSETSRLLTSSLSLGIPVPRPTQCIRDM